MTLSARIGLVLVGLLALGCGDKKKDAPSTKSANSQSQSPDQREKALTKAFIAQFLDAIEANDVKQFAPLMNPARLKELEAEGVMDKVYAAWQRATLTVAGRLREASFRLERANGKMKLYFDGVIVANAPDNDYSMAVTILDGKMYIDEN